MVDASAIGSEPRRILLVTPRADRRQILVVWLASTGQAVTALAAFEEARAELDARSYDLLITDLKLGAFNGLQLVIRERVRGGSRAIVLGEPEPVLQAEAERHGALYLIEPVDRARLLAAVEQLLFSNKAARRFPRTLVLRLDATVNEVPVRVLDVSYEGLRFELAAEQVVLPPSFTVRVQSFPASFRARRIWTSGQGIDRGSHAAEKPTVPEGTIQYGAQLAAMDSDTFSLWRAIVDTASRATTLN